MRLAEHRKLLLLASSCWVIFVIIGWPSYYLSWSFNNLLYFCVAVYFLVGLAIYRMVNNYDGNRLMRSLWVAFYLTVPLIVYDYIYIVLLRKESFELMNSFWFLSVFYIIPWIQALFIYLFSAIDKNNKKSWLILGLLLFVISILLKSYWATFEGSIFDVMFDIDKRKVTLLELTLKLTIYGTVLIASILSFCKFVKGIIKVQK